jgi:MYXO-CTERM domain-containing protein
MGLRRPVLALLVLSMALQAGPAQAAYTPKVAVVLCPESYNSGSFRRQVHRSTQALVGLAGLVGAPYDTLLLDELLGRSGVYSSVWFGSCSALSDGSRSELADFLEAHLARGGSVLLDGSLGAYDPDGSFNGSGQLGDVLNIEALGSQGGSGWVVRTSSQSHPLSALPGWAAGTVLTQGMFDGTDAVGIADDDAPGSQTLLEMSGGGDRQPFLVTTGVGAGRVLGISGYGSDAGPATPFRNDPPSGFFDNQLLPRLVEAAAWLLSPDEPSVGLLLSHAPMTAVVRLDGDVSGESDSSSGTVDYLLRVARETGVTSAYGIVSAFAQGSDWDGFDEMPELERLGGAIGSHSHTHNNDMSGTLPAEGWNTEVTQSLAIIRDQFTDGAFRPPVQLFINPGVEILWGDYRRFFGSIRTYLTHGLEMEVPYACGISAFGTPAVAILNNVPAPDFAWFYDMNWRYSIPDASMYQRRILSYYQNRVGRGVLYNQMWHDYAITGDPPIHFPNDRAVAMHDAVREHFARERIYAPAVAELTTKLHLAQRTQLTAQTSGGTITTTLDLSRLAAEERVQLAGMGLRMNRPGKPIVFATVDGTPHLAFTGDTIILPPTRNGSMVVAAQTGDPVPAAAPRLTYLSKAARTWTSTAESLRIDLAAPGHHTRFCFAPSARQIVLGADRYGPADGGESCGLFAFGSSGTGFELRALAAPENLSFTAADRRIVNANVAGATVTLEVATGQSGDRLSFRASAAPVSATVAGSAVSPSSQGGGAYVLPMGASRAATVVLQFAAPPPPPPPPDAAPPPPPDAAVTTSPDAPSGSSDAGASSGPTPDGGGSTSAVDAGVGGGGSEDASAGPEPYPPARPTGAADGGPGRGGTTGRDAAIKTDAPYWTKLGGGGGCSCSVDGGARPGWGLGLVLGVFLVLGRRRLSRARGS